MNIPITLKIHEIWGDQEFSKSEWGSINYLVGPNGTGKSRFLEVLKQMLPHHKLKVRYLHSDRLISWTKQENLVFVNSQLTQGGINFDWFDDLKISSRTRGEVNDAFVLLKENLNIRVKVESILSKLLNRTVVLEEKGGFLIPSVIKGTETSYNFKEKESHGLKEIITLLTLLHDDSYNCFLIDEPEMHLHPQFQSYFLKVVREFAGNPLEDQTKKCFFFVTHSPHIVDIRTIDDLTNCIIFQPEKIPTYLDSTLLEPHDETKITNLLPRLNTHHKQFFFSPRPVFVEGYMDQQIFSFIQEKRGKFLDYAGSTFIDVTGKDELDLFFRLCKHLMIDCQIITDLDSLVKGRLRESVSNDERCKTFLQKKGISVEFLKAWSEIAQKVDGCINEFLQISSSSFKSNKKLVLLHETLSNTDEDEGKRYIFLVSLEGMKEELVNILKSKSSEITFVSGRIKQIVEGFKRANVHVLEKGQLENFYPEDEIENPFSISAKTKTRCFNTERDFLLQSNPSEEEINNRYNGLIEILDSVTSATKINYKPFLLRYIRKFIFDVQDAFNYNEINDLETMKNHTRINFQSYEKILDDIKFTKNNSSFKCIMVLKGFEGLTNTTIEFNDKTNPTEINI